MESMEKDNHQTLNIGNTNKLVVAYQSNGSPPVLDAIQGKEVKTVNSNR